MGIGAALNRGRGLDWFSMVFATVGISAPVFVISVLLMYLFCGMFPILPSFGLNSWKSYILPVACLAFNPIAYIARQTRSSMLEAMEQDYVRTARAKGVSEFWVVVKHALEKRDHAGGHLPGAAGGGAAHGLLHRGAALLHSGIGRYFVQSISDRDYTMIMGITIFFGVFVVVCNLVVDVVLAVIDPRVKLASKLTLPGGVSK